MYLKSVLELKHIMILSLLIFSISCSEAVENFGEEGNRCLNGDCYYGLTCKSDVCVDLCGDISCNNWEKCNIRSGVCEPNDGRCNEEYDCPEGHYCENNICINPETPCEFITCGDNGTCITSDENKPACDCDDGFHDEDLICILDECSPDTENACGEHSTCKELNGFRCICDESYTSNGTSCIENSKLFITTWKTDNIGESEGNEIIIPINPKYSYNYNVDCNSDGILEFVNLKTDAVCIYDTPGTYRVSINGVFPQIYFNNTKDKNKIISVEQWGINPWVSMTKAFAGCSNLEVNASDIPDLSGVEDTSYMFYYASNFNQDISAWDTGNLKNMEWMFAEAILFNQDISNWNVSNVENMEGLFYHTAAFNQDISSWNVSKVKKMGYMFYYAVSFNQNIGNWTVSMVDDMSNMFRGSLVFNQDISSWNVSNVRDMSNMFHRASVFNQPIGSWDTGNVRSFSYMFNNALAFNQDLSSWNTGRVEDMSYMFSQADVFNQDISVWNVSNVKDFSYMFYEAVLFNQDISTWVLDRAKNTSYMFYKASVFNQDISNWNVKNVTNMMAMFYKADSFNQDIGKWDISNVMNMISFLKGVTLSVENYDNILIKWSNLNLQNGLFFDAGNSNYCDSDSSRQNIIDNYNWTIVDGGLKCSE